MKRENARQRKQSLVDSFGGGCQKCGYNRCLSALHFHHIDGREERRTHRDAILIEVAAHPERVRLLCANCHIEEHDRIDDANGVFARCQFCDKEFRTPPYKLTSERAKYCSRACYFAAKRRDAIAESEERFWSRVDKTDGCWIWRGYVANDGLGRFSVLQENGKWRAQLVRRLAFEFHHGHAPFGPVEVTCKNRLCVRPDHLVG